MVLLFLVVVWLVVLGPSVLRRVRERRETEVESVGTFHRELRILEHASPPFFPPAYRLRGAAAGPSGPALRAKPVLRLVNGEPLPPPALAFLGMGPDGHEPAGSVPDGTAGVGDSQGGGLSAGDHRGADHRGADHRTARREPDARRLLRQRRRDTLTILLAVTLLSMIAGGFGLGGAWIMALLAGLSAVVYVWMLVNLRARADERERKLHYLDHDASRSDMLPGVVDGRNPERARPGALATNWSEWDGAGNDEIAVGYDGVDLGELWASRLAHPARAAR